MHSFIRKAIYFWRARSLDRSATFTVLETAPATAERIMLSGECRRANPWDYRLRALKLGGGLRGVCNGGNRACA